MPRIASSPEPLAGEDYFCQDKLVLVVSLQTGRCGIPSRSIFGKRTRDSINKTSHQHRETSDSNLDWIYLSVSLYLCVLDSGLSPFLIVGFQVPAKPLRFEHWDAHKDISPSLARTLYDLTA